VSTLESIFWHILGYSAIPVILLGGVLLSMIALFVLLQLTGYSGDDADE
jgi:uncharacterized protein (TIGR02808 family)